MQLSASALLIIQGMTWLAMGVFLLCKGVLMTTLLIAFPQFASLAFAKGSTLVGGHATAVALLISLGMACGWLKARFVLMKVIRKNVQRLLQLSAPIPLSKIFEGRYYLIVGLMIALGITLRKLGLSPDIHGLITMIIGSALLNGSFLIFRFAQEVRQRF